MRSKKTYDNIPKYFREMNPIYHISWLPELRDEDEWKNRAQLLLRMWFWEKKIEKIPLFITNNCGTWINPYIVYKFYWEIWFPVEIFMDVVRAKTLVKNPEKYWYTWCDFWLDTFMTWDMKRIKENFITPYI